MFKRLLRNTVISGVAFFVVSVLGLLIIPVIVNAYGLAVLGLIVLLRSMLPTGLLSVLDFGVSETTTQIVARSRESGNWDEARGRITLLLLLISVMGLLVTGLMFVLAPWLPALFQVGPDKVPPFIEVVRFTAVSLLLLMPSLLAEGVIKGFEQYGVLRLGEMLSAVAYAGGTIWIAGSGWPWQWVALVFLASVVGRAAIICVHAALLLRRSGFRLGRWTVEDRREVLRRAKLMSGSRMLGIFQTQVNPVLIGVLVGPAGVGVYDVLVRLPRFAKVVIGLLNSSLLPVAARLDQKGDDATISRLGALGSRLLPTVMLPGLVGAAILSEDILRLWLGPDLTAFWPWMAAMFLTSIMFLYIGFGQTMMLIRAPVIAALNRIVLFQLVIGLVISFSLVPVYQERAFIAGQTIGMLATFPVQMRRLLREMGVKGRPVFLSMAKVIGVVIAAGGGLLVLRPYLAISNLVELAGVLAVWCLIVWSLTAVTVMSRDDRAATWRMVSTALIR